MFGQEVKYLHRIVINWSPGEVTRPGGDGPHQGQAPVQRASSNHRFCQGDIPDSFLTIFIQQPLVCVLYCTDRCHRLGSQPWGWWTRTATPISSPTQCLAMTIVRTLSKCFSTSPSRLSWQAKRRENWNNSNDFPLMFPESDIRDGKGNGGSVIERGQGQRKTWKRR